MKFLVLGATGATGSLFVEQALAADHDVTAYVRDPGKVAARDRLTVIAGQLSDVDALTEAMRGQDAVVSMLGLGRAKAGDFIAESSRAIAEAAEHSGTKRVLIMSAFGVGESLPKASSIARFMYSLGGKAIYADKAAGERILTAADLDLTIAYPVLLTSGPVSDNARAIDLAELTRLPGVPRISRADVAAFFLDAAENGTWSRRTAVLTTAR